ncbi:hypothetical protein MRCP2_p3010 (plasmid) [Aquipseudomonas alcaligenes]|nr:hypothetical protein MRCP2_p3010 [Pseudomonas alcaligenes]
MACLDASDAIARAEEAARRLGVSMAIYTQLGVFVVRPLGQRTGHELEVVQP